MRMNRMAALAAGAMVFAACSETANTPVSPRAAKPSFALGDTPAPTPDPVLGSIVVCKTGNAGGSFDVTRVAVGASTGQTTGLNTSIPTGTCKEVASDLGGDQVGSNVTIDEDPADNTVQTVTACAFLSAGGQPQSCTFTDGQTVFLNSFHAYVITYNNEFTPPTGNEGCTPGYWKQDQHFDSWPVPTNTTFSSVFGAGIYGGTLLQALGLNGGDINALIRHGAAAYLNAASGDVDYAYTVAQVIDIVQGDGAYAGLSVEARKNLLDAANNGVGGCPLN